MGVAKQIKKLNKESQAVPSILKDVVTLAYAGTWSLRTKVASNAQYNPLLAPGEQDLCCFTEVQCFCARQLRGHHKSAYTACASSCEPSTCTWCACPQP